MVPENQGQGDMNNSMVETLIGAVVIVIAGAFLAFAYNTPGMGQKTSGYVITAEFDNVDLRLVYRIPVVAARIFPN